MRKNIPDIRDILFARLHAASGKTVSYHHKVSTHIGAGDIALLAFIQVLNDTPGFSEDGLSLVPGDIKRKPNVAELLGAIFRDYTSRGWDLYHD